ncbi:DUF3489 domain-containing protein [Roseiarcaceae bacterium H3SJ34-1]|uniref:DUF3489 domain-containing protein n=1 Tax=Terripilifer ovatus TaxID=3032367 RepID=UPI003AB95765|nr:DUF3489 domain-containing protein [Roseiarcaceae bacterium H3SJ34-1]
MAKLSDTQMKFLSVAAGREDGAATLPNGLPKAAATKVAASLISRKLIREIRSKPDMPVWRTDDQGRSMSLVLLRAGKEAVMENAAGETDDASSNASDPEPAIEGATPTVTADGPPLLEDAAQSESQTQVATAPTTTTEGLADAEPAEASLVGSAPRAGTKQKLVMDMLAAPNGSSLTALTEATNWLPHTTRAVITGLRKRGYIIERKRADGITTYRIVEGEGAEAA